MWKATSVTAAELYSAFIRYNFISLCIRLSFIHKTHALISLFYSCCVKLACFYERQFSQIWLNISLSDSVLETKKLQAKVLNSTCRTIPVVNYCRLWTLLVCEFDGLKFLTAAVLKRMRKMVNFKLGKHVFRLVEKLLSPHKSFSISLPSLKLNIFLILSTKHDAIDIADPSSMQVSYMKFCGSIMESDRSAESDCLRFDSSWRLTRRKDSDWLIVAYFMKV